MISVTEKTIEVLGKHFDYVVADVVMDSPFYQETHDTLMSEGFWLGTQADRTLSYFKFIGGPNENV